MATLKRLVSTLLIAAAAFGLVPGQALAETASAPRILLDGVNLAFPAESPPAVIEQRTMVPFRAIAEALGVDVVWNQSDWSIDAIGLGKQVHLKIDDPVMWVDHIPVVLDVPPQIANTRTMVPLRAFSAAFDAKVDWDQANYTAVVVSPVWTMRTLGFYALGSYGRREFMPRFSDVAFGWAELHGDGTVSTASHPDYRWPVPDDDITGERLVAETQRAGTRGHLMVYMSDADDELTKLVLDPVLSEKAAEEIAAMVQEKGFDGVVLDLEGLGLVEEGEALELVRQGFTRLATMVSEKLRAIDRQTIISVHPLNGAYYGQDYAALVQVADALQIMAFRYAKADEYDPEPVDRIAEALNLAVDAVGKENRHKLLLGIVSSYETDETILQKVGLAKRYRVGGISVWTIGAMRETTMDVLETSVIREP